MDDKNKIGNIEAIAQDDKIGIKSTNSPFAQSFYFNDVYNEKEVKSFIKKTERLIRSSKEYNTYINLLRTNNDALNHDNILSNITTGDTKTMEFHHYPFTLYDIIQIIMLHNILANKNITSLSIAKEVMENHFKHYIGIVPLTKTMHELAHGGKLFLSTKQIFGNYKKFMEIYSDGINTELKNQVKTIEELSAKNTPSDFGGLLQ